jgi:hypothetical protein
MAETTHEEMLARASKNAAEYFKAIEPEAVIEPVMTEPIIEETPVVIDNSSLNNPEPPADEKTPIENELPIIENSPIVQKTLEDYLIERSGGKIKSWEEIEPLLTPKELKFANDKIKRLNELAEEGVEIDEDFIIMQSKDFKGMTNPEQVLLEAMRQDKKYKGWSEKLLKAELNDKYKRNEWISEGIDDDASETELLYRQKFSQDAEEARQSLIQKQEATSIKSKVPSQSEIDANQERMRQNQMKWEQDIDSVISKTSKLSTLIDEKSKEVFDYEIPEPDKKDVARIMKGMINDPALFWNEFKDVDGKIDNKQIYELLALKKSKDNMLKILAKNYQAKGAASEFDRIKNVGFKPDSGKIEIVKETREERNQKYAREAMKKAGTIK